MKYNLEERIELAKELRKSGYNCAQVVACAFSEDYDIGRDTMLKVSEAFGGGMAMQSVCGAVSAMMMLSGLERADGNVEKPSTKGKTYKLAKRFQQEFKDKNGSLICKELKSKETPNGVVECNTCILSAVEMYHKFLSEEK